MALMRGSSDNSRSQSTGLATASLGQCLPPQEQLLGSRHHEFRFEVKLPLKFFEWHRGPNVFIAMAAERTDSRCAQKIPLHRSATMRPKHFGTPQYGQGRLESERISVACHIFSLRRVEQPLNRFPLNAPLERGERCVSDKLPFI